MTPPPPPAPPGGTVVDGKASSRATTSLILGILGFVCCQVCAPFAWHMGNQELKAIAAGQSSMAGQGIAMAGKILGIIGSVFLIFAVLWMLFFGGMAVVGALFGNAAN